MTLKSGRLVANILVIPVPVQGLPIWGKGCQHTSKAPTMYCMPLGLHETSWEFV